MLGRLLKAEPARLVGAVTAVVQAAVLLGVLPPTAEARVGTAISALVTLAAALGIRQLVYSPGTVARLRALDRQRHYLNRLAPPDPPAE